MSCLYLTIFSRDVRTSLGLYLLCLRQDSGVGFDSTSKGDLEIYSVSVTGEDPVLKGKVSCDARFASIAWTPFTGSPEQQYPEGLIAGGMADGTIVLFNPAAIIENGDGVLAMLPAPAPKSGPVEALQFSSLDTYNLCAGTYSGHVSIVDCTEAEGSPSVRLYGPVAAEITAVAWNTAVAHIVATAQGDGSVTVWDCNTGQPWCEIRAEHAGQAVTDVAWNPAQGLHLMTASGDDRNPVLKVWDLGASTSVPLGTLAGHSAGIFAVAWCPHDDSLLLTVAKDNRTLLWDLRTLVAVAELPMDATSAPDQQQQQGSNSAGALFASGRPGLAEQKQLRVAVQWSPFQRGVALTCSLDKKVQIHSLLSLANCAGRPPAWMTPKSAVSTGFGGMLIHCGQGMGGTVTIRTIQEQPELAETSVALETELMQHHETIIEFCKLQQEKVEAMQDKALWGFMQVVFETNARQVLLLHLGFDSEEIAASAHKFSEDLASGAEELATVGSDHKCMPEAAQELVSKALVVGNYDAAIECCLETGSFADALVLAAVAGGDLWGKTQEKFFASESSKRSYLTTVSGVVRGQLDELVANSETVMWHETLAILSTYAQSEEFPTLCVALGDRLQEAGDESSASLCYMCALNLERAVKFWQNQLFDKVSSSDFTTTTDLLALHEFVVKVSVFAQAAGPSATLTPEIEELFTKYSQVLAEQGLLATATKYCKGMTQTSMELRDRLYRSRASQRCYAYLGAAPEFPYEMANVQQSRGQVMAQPKVVEPEQQEAPAMNGNGYAQQADYGQQQQVYGQQQQYDQQQQQQQQQLGQQQQAYPAPVGGGGDELPPGWVALQDPTSGMTYYANQTTGETTWDRPQPPAPAPVAQPAYSTPQAAFGASQQQQQFQPQEQQTRQDPAMDTSVRSQVTTQSSASKAQKATLASKYGDGFVSSASNPELANQYGNVGTANPYGETSRPGPAAAVTQNQNAPISGSLNFDSLQLSNHHSSIKDTLLGTAEALKCVNLNPVEKRQLAEAEKGVAILVKKLARDALSDHINEQVFGLTSAVAVRDYGTASNVQTSLANSEWREHKDWLKGIKILIQLASKKLV